MAGIESLGPPPAHMRKPEPVEPEPVEVKFTVNEGRLVIPRRRYHIRIDTPATLLAATALYLRQTND